MEDHGAGGGATLLPDVVERQLGDQVDALFEDLYAVVILDSDTTTFAEVERACMVLFAYGREEAEALSHRVHTTGEAVAAVMARREAARTVSALRAGNVRSRMARA